MLRTARRALLAAAALSLLAITGQARPAASAQTVDQPAAATAAALAATGGITLADCLAGGRQAGRSTRCLDLAAVPSPAEIGRGIAVFSLAEFANDGGAIGPTNSPLSAGLVVMGLDGAGAWQFWFGAQQLYQRLGLPGGVRVCADGDSANVRAAPGLDAEIVTTLADFTEATAEQFVLTQAGAFEGLVNGFGWYRISGPAEGWVYSTLLTDAMLVGCNLRDLLVPR